MLSLLRVARPLHAIRPLTRVRHYAQPTNEPPSQIHPHQSNSIHNAAHAAGSRPHHGIKVDPEHGLWAFFRKQVDDKGEAKYETIESVSETVSGRSWSAAELRRKSFQDLHTLWYVVLRERNLLATQDEEMRRHGISNTAYLSMTKKKFQCRKTMARIKYVLNERRLAYEGTVNTLVHEKEKQIEKRASRWRKSSGIRTRISSARAALQEKRGKRRAERVLQSRLLGAPEVVQTVQEESKAEEKILVNEAETRGKAAMQSKHLQNARERAASMAATSLFDERPDTRS